MIVKAKDASKVVRRLVGMCLWAHAKWVGGKVESVNIGMHKAFECVAYHMTLLGRFSIVESTRAYLYKEVAGWLIFLCLNCEGGWL